MLTTAGLSFCCPESGPTPLPFSDETDSTGRKQCSGQRQAKCFTTWGSSGMGREEKGNILVCPPPDWPPHIDPYRDDSLDLSMTLNAIIFQHPELSQHNPLLTRFTPETRQGLIANMRSTSHLEGTFGEGQQEK